MLVYINPTKAVSSRINITEIKQVVYIKLLMSYKPYVSNISRINTSKGTRVLSYSE
jgi:hypothetical protein